jgi:hypothetical protein
MRMQCRRIFYTDLDDLIWFCRLFSFEAALEAALPWRLPVTEREPAEGGALHGGPLAPGDHAARRPLVWRLAAPPPP